MSSNTTACPFDVGNLVVFAPSDRTRGLYQNIERFGLSPGDAKVITEVRDGLHLYFAGGIGGWPWTEFALPE